VKSKGEESENIGVHAHIAWLLRLGVARRVWALLRPMLRFDEGLCSICASHVLLLRRTLAMRRLGKVVGEEESWAEWERIFELAVSSEVCARVLYASM